MKYGLPLIHNAIQANNRTSNTSKNSRAKGNKVPDKSINKNLLYEMNAILHVQRERQQQLGT